MSSLPKILAIAGSDSGGGAGIQADIKTITMLGGYAMTAITAITAQNSKGVSAIASVPAEMVVEQMNQVIGDFGVDAVKIGMIGDGNTALAVAERLETLEHVPIVFDPVMVASSGASLADRETLAAFARLMDVATLVTPNLPELAALGGEEAILDHGCALLVKGGHQPGDTIIDRLYLPDGSMRKWSGERIASSNTHGTGCTLASGIATGLGKGLSMADAVTGARAYLRGAIEAAPDMVPENGPLGHGLGLSLFDAISK